MNKHRDSYEKLSPKVQWTVSDDLAQEVIFCYHEKQNENPNWNNMESYVKKRTERKWVEKIDERQVIFVRMEADIRIQNTARQQAKRTGLATVTGSAYPFLALEQEVKKAMKKAQHYRFYALLLRRIYEESSKSNVIYIVSEQKSVSEPTSPIYVGRTEQLLERRLAGHKNAEYKGFMGYVRDRHTDSADWSVHALSYEERRSFAVEGQVTPDLLENNREAKARQLLDEMYSRDHNWGLVQAETALITYYRPHFNKSKNIYPSPLQYADYCQKRCPVCNPTPK